MKHSILWAFLLIAFGLLSGLPAAAQQRATKNVPPFTALKASSGIEVYLSQSDTPSVKIEVDSEETLQNLVVEVDGSNTLIIRLPASKQARRWWSSKPNPRVKAYVSFRELTDIQLSSGASLQGEGELRFKSLTMSASGGADIRMNLQAEQLEVACTGGADAELQGRVATVKGSASGGSDLEAELLEAQTATVSASGGSDVSIRVVRELMATASGGSDVVYFGSPTNVSANATGGSDITKGQ